VPITCGSRDGGQARARLDPGKVDIDTYVLSAVDDHIVPWVSGYKATQLLGGCNRYVLSTSGHIAGIVNPTGPKAKHWVSEQPLPADPHQWKDAAQLKALLRHPLHSLRPSWVQYEGNYR